MQSKNRTLPSWSWIIPPFIFVMLGYIFYAPSLHYPFQFDDVANITKFYNIRTITFSSSFFTGARWIGIWLNALNYQMGNLDPYYYRLFNIIIHITTSIMVFFSFLLALTNLKKRSFFKQNSFLIALITGVLFLLHPTQTQTISYAIQGRMEGIVGLFVISMTLWFLVFAHSSNRAIKVLSAILLFASTALSTGAKEAAIVAPILVALVDWFFVAQGEWSSFKKRLWLHITVFSISIFWFVYYLKPKFFTDVVTLNRHSENNFGNTITASRTDKIYPLHFMISEFKVILHYLWIFIWPFSISVDYDWNLVDNFFAPDAIGPFIILLFIGFFILYLLRRNRSHPIAFGLIWFFVSILPRASIIPSAEIISDYKTYLGSMGWLFIIAAAITYIIQFFSDRHFPSKSFAHLSFKKRYHPLSLSAQLIFVILSIALPLGMFTTKRNEVWRSNEEFWGDILKKAPNRARAHNNYGYALAKQKRFSEAVPYFKRAIRMDPLYPDPVNNLAVSYSHLGQMDSAIDALRNNMDRFPLYPEGHNNLGSFLLRTKQYQEAEQAFIGALQVRDFYGKAAFNLGRTYREWSQTIDDEEQTKELLEKSFQAFKYACTKASFDNDLHGWHEYSVMSLALDKKEDALFSLNKILSYSSIEDEDSPGIKSSAALNLGNLHFSNKNYEQAKQAYSILVQLQPNHGLAWSNLAETSLNLGNHQEALQLFQRAKSIDSRLEHIDLRIAACLTELGKPNEARALLQNYLQIEGNPAHFRTIAQKALFAMDQRA